MKTTLKIAEMLDHGPTWLKDAASHVAKDSGLKTDDLELHRHTHSEKAKVNQIDAKSRQSLKYVSARTQDRDDEIVIPQAIDLKEFRKYMHVLVNHNYSLLPIGSDEWIEADEYGIKSLTTHADTGEGTLANVIWHLVEQGHMKSSSIGFVPTSFTKPGARDWDHVTNQMQSQWKEFDKARAEKSISRIITGGVLLEHSFVSVPCNADAEMLSVAKSLSSDDKVFKQLGWEMADGVLVNKAEQPPDMPKEKVPCVCDECGRVADAFPGMRCTEKGCNGTMKPKGKEKAIELSSKGEQGTDVIADARKKELEQQFNWKEGDVFKRGDESFRIVKFVEGDSSGKAVIDKAASIPCTCDECDAEANCAPGSACQEEGCEGTMVADQKKKEATIMNVKVVRPPQTVKVLFTPPDPDVVAKGISQAVERALSRKTGRIL